MDTRARLGCPETEPPSCYCDGGHKQRVVPCLNESRTLWDSDGCALPARTRRAQRVHCACVASVVYCII